MTQELNKEGLLVAESILYKKWNAGVASGLMAQDAIQAYLSHPKVTGFESRVAEFQHDLDDGLIIPSEILMDTINDMQAALAGGGHE